MTGWLMMSLASCWVLVWQDAMRVGAEKRKGKDRKVEAEDEVLRNCPLRCFSHVGRSVLRLPAIALAIPGVALHLPCTCPAPAPGCTCACRPSDRQSPEEGKPRRAPASCCFLPVRSCLSCGCTLPAPLCHIWKHHLQPHTSGPLQATPSWKHCSLRRSLPVSCLIQRRTEDGPPTDGRQGRERGRETGAAD